MQYSQALTETLSNLVAQQPFFATYLYNNMEIGENPDIPTARTNGTRIEVNPDWFGSKPIPQRVFIMCHEVMHGILDHMGRDALYINRGFGPDMLPFNKQTSNEAQDYVINAMLREARVGEMPPSGLWDPNIKGTDLSDEVYVNLNAAKQDKDAQDKSDNAPGEGSGDSQGQSNQPGDQGQGDGDDNSPPTQGTDEPGEGFDEHIAAGTAKPEQEQKTAMAQAMQAAEAMGAMPESLKRAIGQLIEPEISWEEQFRNAVTARQGQDTQTWLRPNRRRIAIAPHIYVPGKTGHQIGGLVLAIDVSGSIDQPMLTKFMSEATGLLQEVKAEWIKVICINTYVDPDQCWDIDDPSELQDLDITGGGGTDLEQLHRYLDDEDIYPEQIVFFTDGITSYRSENPFPCDVTWCLTTERRTPPYGTNVYMK